MNYKEQLEQYNKDVKAQVEAWIDSMAKDESSCRWQSYLSSNFMLGAKFDFTLKTYDIVNFTAVNFLNRIFSPQHMIFESFGGEFEIHFKGVVLPNSLSLPIPPAPLPDRYVYVICQRAEEYRPWCNENDMIGHKNRQAVYVGNEVDIKVGLVEGWEVVLVGNWKKRIDLEYIRNRLVTLGFKNIPEELMPREVTKAAAIAANVYWDDYRVFHSDDYMEFWDSLSYVKRQNVLNALKELPDYKKGF